MERDCDACGDPYEAKTKRSRFCSANCRVAYSRGTRADVPAGDEKPASPPGPDDELIAPALRTELMDLGVHGHYEARTALKLARQLDSGVIVGAAFTSLSKELDRRVDALRLRATRPDDPVAALKQQVDEARLRLVEGAG